MMKIGMLFPGYGSQFVGMGKELYDTSRTVQEYFEEASNCLNENFVKLCFASSDEELSKVQNAYPALFLFNVAVSARLKEKGIVPDVVAGYGLGEYGALYAAGGLTFPDGLYVVNKCAFFYQELLNTIDVAALHILGIPRITLEQECAVIAETIEPLTIACYNSETDHIISGYKTAIEAFTDKMNEYKEAKCKSISPAMGLHSSLMDTIVEQLVIHLTKVDFHDLNIPLITCASAKHVTKGDQVKDGIIAQIHHPIMWDQLLTQLSDCDLVIEIGPHSFLSNVVKEQYPNKKIVSVQKQADIDEIIKILEYTAKNTEL